MTKRPSLFSAKTASTPEPERPALASLSSETPPATAASEPSAQAARYQKASTREGKRVVTAYISPEAFRQLKRVAADEDAQVQDLLTEGLNAVFAARGLSRIA
ncbi:ribbon-helix-helix domain-containing protein [Methylobacterium trifolii]|uniref:Antitoxin-like ribbon-helix-helix domain-containing protein n=1 Tax=Methylobacterium trifolii TaxID=1003092 RepID=A0ABQ4UAE2_9HYPH|nr:ribbon-helix-helix domain-containing protein [Methylobacterium trifolii]GJE62720.1 hypothetical protein MPOCJGCO_4855 [Methylobacterium trifolii]